MVLKKIEQMAKRQHALLLAAAAGLAVTAALGTTAITSADSSTVGGSLYQKPSTELAQKADLGQDLSYHHVKSSQLGSLLVHQFKQTSDSDVVRRISDIASDKFKTKPNATFKFSGGLLKAYGANQGNSGSDKVFSVVSDANSGSDSDHSNTMTYFVTKQNLILRQLFTAGDSTTTLTFVKYHLHSIAKANNGNREMIFYPVEYSREEHDINVIPKNKRSNYPMRLFIQGNGSSSTSRGSSSHLLPD